jgi:hypothetical protein
MRIDVEAIRRLSINPKLAEFGSFVQSQTEPNTLPNYRKIDLMLVPRLVPHVFVFDVLNSTDKLVMKYCGTKIDEFYGSNLMGKCLIDHYKGSENFDEIEDIYWQAIRTKTPAYTLRPIHLVNERVERFRVAETVLFPCSSDQETVNYTIGVADYFDVPSSQKKSVTLIE